MMAMRRWQRPPLAGAAALLMLLSTAAEALAHATLVGSEPRDSAVLERGPERVQLFFSEAVEPEFFALEVYASDRSRVDRADARLSATDPRVLEAGLRDAGAGTYTVVWRVLSLDGHVVRGSFAFAVGAGATLEGPLDLGLPTEGAPFALEAAARWLIFLAAFVLLGGFTFRPLVFAPAIRAAGIGHAELESPLVRRWLWVAWGALGLFVLVSFASLLFQAASAAGVPLGDVLGGRALTRLLTTTRYGVLWALRILLLVGLVGVLAWLSVSPVAAHRWAWWLGVLISAAAVLTISASGHAIAVQEMTWLAVFADWAHLLAGALWVGGLVQLGAALPAAFKAADAPGRRRLLGHLVPRFSWLAGLCVATLVVTGLYAGRIYVPSWAALLDTPYGSVLSGKLLLVAPLVALGAINLLVFHPRFRRAARSTNRLGDDARGRHIFRLVVLGEVALAAAVLAVTGLLTGTPPASSLPLEGKPFSEAQRTLSYATTLDVSPNQAGDNRLEVAVTDQRGAPVQAERVRLILTMLDMDMGAREVEVQPVTSGRYEARGGYLSMAGQWQAEVAVRRTNVEEVARFRFTVGQAPGANRPAFSPARILLLAVTDPGRERGLPINPRAVLALVALAGAAFILVRMAKLRRRRDRRQMRAISTMLVVLGAERWRVLCRRRLPAQPAQSRAGGHGVTRPRSAGL
jgi:copper transport protein